jgi:hypothetical protein
VAWTGSFRDGVREANLDELRYLSDGCIRDEQLEFNEHLELVRRQVGEIEGQRGNKQTGRGLFSIPQCRLGPQTFLYATGGYYSQISVTAIGVLAQLRQAKIAIAIERFQRRENQLPGSLKELVPEYLQEIPLDPFDGKGMRYKIEGPDSYRLWAVGANLSDEMGMEIPSKKRAPVLDVIWRRLPPK